MKRFIVLLCVVQCLFIESGQASLSLDQAYAAAVKIWGSAGFARQVGRNYQLGCVVDGKTIVVATSKDSWDDAFARVNMQINGPHVITAEARDTNGNIATSAPVLVFSCNP
jgi:hypothetical protein